MKSTILVLLVGLSLSTFASATNKTINVARCDSDCWLDHGDYSGGRQCFDFYISTNGSGKYRAKMIGGYDDAGNSNAYDLGPVVKSVSADGETSFTTQKKSYVRSIQFSSMSPNSSCSIIDSNNRIYEGRSLSVR